MSLVHIIHLFKDIYWAIIFCLLILNKPRTVGEKTIYPLSLNYWAEQISVIRRNRFYVKFYTEINLVTVAKIGVTF